MRQLTMASHIHHAKRKSPLQNPDSSVQLPHKLYLRNLANFSSILYFLANIEIYSSENDFFATHLIILLQTKKRNGHYHNHHYVCKNLFFLTECFYVSHKIHNTHKSTHRQLACASGRVHSAKPTARAQRLAIL